MKPNDPGPQTYNWCVEQVETVIGTRMRITITVPAFREMDGTEHEETTITICPSVLQWWSIVNQVGEVADSIWQACVETN